jgi:hypothetical protein
MKRQVGTFGAIKVYRDKTDEATKTLIQSRHFKQYCSIHNSTAVFVMENAQYGSAFLSQGSFRN